MTARTVPAALQRLRGSARRIGALSRAEAVLLRRNPMALLTALGTPLIGVVLLNAFPASGSVPLPGASVVVTVTAFALLFPLYYNLVTTLVARREQLVLKRLRSSECTDTEILIGAGAPAMTIAWGQTIIGVVVASLVLGMALPVNPALVIGAVLLGTVVFLLLAAASTAMTRTVEMAQLSTMPVVLVSMILGGLFPPAMLPGPLPWVAEFLPLTQVVDLMWLGLTGTTRDGTGGGGSFSGIVAALLILGAWVAAGVLARPHFMRWEPRT
jgi:ABC-2 type transport system permease protein